MSTVSLQICWLGSKSWLTDSRTPPVRHLLLFPIVISVLHIDPVETIRQPPDDTLPSVNPETTLIVSVRFYSALLPSAACQMASFDSSVTNWAWKQSVFLYISTDLTTVPIVVLIARAPTTAYLATSRSDKTHQRKLHLRRFIKALSMTTSKCFH